MKHYHHLCNEEWLYIWQARREGNTQNKLPMHLASIPHCPVAKSNGILCPVSFLYLPLGDANRV